MENTKKNVSENVVDVADEVVNKAVEAVVEAEADNEGEIFTMKDLIHTGIFLQREAYKGKNGSTFYHYYVVFKMLGKEKRCTFVTPKQNIGKDTKGEKIYVREIDGYELLDDMFNAGDVELCVERKVNFNKEQIIPYAYILDVENEIDVSYPLKTESNADASVFDSILSTLKRKGIIK